VEATSASRPHALRIPKPRRLLAALSDERLVEHVRRGEPAAFEVLYDRYSAGILGFCRHMLGNQSDAEDATQHTFISAHADILRHSRRDLHVKAWVYAIARNRCLSMLRARREQPSADGIELATADLQQDVQQRDDLRALLADVTKLPDDQREALVLSEVGDLSHGEIAEVIGCEVSKVKSLVFQARTALIDRRTARDTSCEEIREQLATLRGGALRRSHLRHHLESCPGCAHYRDEIKRQRAMLAVALPVIPSAALKANVFGAIGLGGGSAAAGAAGGGAAAAASSGISAAAPLGLAAKVGVAAVLAFGGATGAATVANNGHIPLLQDTATNGSSGDDNGGGSGAGAVPAGTTSGTTTSEAAKRKHKTTGSRRSAKGTEKGFTPVTGESNGDRAREFAKTRGKGKERSAARRHATAHKRSKPAKRVHVKKVRTRTRVTPTRPESTTKTTETTTPTRTHATPAPKTTTETTPTTTETTPTTTTGTGTTTGDSTGQSLGGAKRNTLATG
jgi:RNA polymerase sigma factor (sigma-70 family)